jgi:RNA polymerase sigma-70 factor (ECF subfamily)
MTRATINHPIRPAVRARLQTLWERTNDAALLCLTRGESPIDGAAPANEEQCNNVIGTCLMNLYQETREPEALALLYDLNRSIFLRQIHAHLSGRHGRVDANDVLQEAFLNICRYPDRFVGDHADAFHSWAHRIVRNTALRFIHVEARQPLHMILDDENDEPEDTRVLAPIRVASQREGAVVVNQSYVLFLVVYLQQFEALRDRDRRVLTMTEIDGRRYRDIAEELGLTVLNVKMIVFRARRRILRGMTQALARLPSGRPVDAGDVRPADPRRLPRRCVRRRC